MSMHGLMIMMSVLKLQGRQFDSGEVYQLIRSHMLHSERDSLNSHYCSVSSSSLYSAIWYWKKFMGSLVWTSNAKGRQSDADCMNWFNWLDLILRSFRSVHADRGALFAMYWFLFCRNIQDLMMMISVFRSYLDVVSKLSWPQNDYSQNQKFFTLWLREFTKLESTMRYENDKNWINSKTCNTFFVSFKQYFIVLFVEWSKLFTKEQTCIQNIYQIRPKFILMKTFSKKRPRIHGGNEWLISVKSVQISQISHISYLS